ncbi:MAG: ErfK/YbiS/YcfS/YnhG family protein [Caulobacteraceae bacterium]|jgi:lipoprotein-anchoring transpeptidase ErfK/SrfK|nr:ErfK/YbiS/YcfS/YnhG family protein [Caulobacteraceae bacterium]
MAKSILVSLPDAYVSVSQDGAEVRRITTFSIGRDGHHTPIFTGGSLSPTKREREHRSSIYPPPHGGALMPYALFFEVPNSACAFHQGVTAVESHGCIHLGQTDAAWLFDWAASDPVGLTIDGPYPARHTFP